MVIVRKSRLSLSVQGVKYHCDITHARPAIARHDNQKRLLSSLAAWLAFASLQQTANGQKQPIDILYVCGKFL